MSTNDQKSLIPTETQGMLCPNCGYDLRGVVDAMCPECGREFSVAEVSAHAGRQWKYDRLFQQLSMIPIGWIVLYLFAGDVFRGTLDRVNHFWIGFTLLNFTLQVFLAVLGYALVRTENKSVRKLGSLLVTCELVFIVSHIVISLVTLI